MEHKTVQVDENLLEKVKYPTGSLPVFLMKIILMIT